MAIGGWTPTYTKEVTGNWYIDLTDAVANKLLELKAYWWCEQASTPTPTTPVDIVCNNWTLKVKDKELPVEYVRLESIDFDGSMHYDTGEHLFGADSVKMTLSNSGSGWRNIFGCYTNTSATDNFSLYVYPSTTSQVYFRYWDNLYRPIFWTGTRTITFWNGGTTGFYSGNVTAQEQTFETSTNAYIWALPNSSSAKLTGTIYWNIEVTSGGTTRLKWIPCKRKGDGVIWYYEAVNWNFLEPSGSGTPVAWAEDYSNLEVYVEWTKEKIWINMVSDIVQNTFVRAANASEERPLWSENYNSTFSCSGYIKVEPNTEYTTVADVYQSATGAGLVFFESNTVESAIKWASTNKQWWAVYTFTTPANCHYVRFSWDDRWGARMYKTNNTATCEDLLWVWDYKDEQEILSGNVVIKCWVMVLDGTENWSTSIYPQTNAYRISWPGATASVGTVRYGGVVCSHFEDGGLSANPAPNKIFFANDLNINFPMTENFDTRDKCVQWLKDQLAAWTPVIIVYPLATPTTLSVAWQTLSIPAWNSRIEIVEWSILNLPLYAKYKSTSE